MNPLNAREWLEGIVRTGAQRSGFAHDALEMLTIAEDAEEGRLAWVDQRDEFERYLAEAPNGARDWPETLDQVVQCLDQYGRIVELLRTAGVIDTVPEDLVGLLAMFVHG